MARQWDDHYRDGQLPWDTGAPDPVLVSLVEGQTIAPGRALEIGCGTGTNALWLAEQGFDVVGVDIAPTAIAQAKAKVGEHQRCRVEVADFVEAAHPGAPFDFVFDRGCFHVFDDVAVQARFAARVAEVLVPGGRWVSILGSTEGAPREMGPPRRSARDVIVAVEPVLEILELRAIQFPGVPDRDVCAWLLVARAREQPAQPSTLWEH